MTVTLGRTVLVGLGSFTVATEPGQGLAARSLGATAALALLDREAEIGGMLHWMLPDSRIDRERARLRPALFADTGLERLPAELGRRGARRGLLTAALAGAASLPEGGAVDVGKRNREAAYALLERAGIRLVHDESGGVVVRDLLLDLGSGEFSVRTANP